MANTRWKVPFGKQNRESKGAPYIRDSKAKGCKYEGVIKATKFLPTSIVYGQSIEDVRVKVLETMATREGRMQDFQPTPQDDKDYYQLLALRAELGVTGRLLDLCKPALEAAAIVKNEGLPNVVWEEGIKTARRLMVTVGQFTTEAYSKVRETVNTTPGRKRNTYKQNMYSALKRLVKFLGAETPVMHVIDGPKSKEFEAWIDSKLVSKNATAAYSTRCHDNMFFGQIFRLGSERFRLPCLNSWVLGKKIEGGRTKTTAPSPEVVHKLRCLLRDEAPPEIFLFGLLQTEFGLRPEEAWRALQDPHSFFLDDRFHFTQQLSKIGTVSDRDVQIRPNSRAWLAEVAGWVEGTRRDYQLVVCCKLLPAHEMVEVLYGYLRRAGFDPAGSMPDECLRKACLSAGIATCDPDEHMLIAQEGSHAGVQTLYKHYDARWTRDMGLAYRYSFPGEIPDGLTDFDAYRAYGQKPSEELPPLTIYEKHATQQPPYLHPSQKPGIRGSHRSGIHSRHRKAA